MVLNKVLNKTITKKRCSHIATVNYFNCNTMHLCETAVHVMPI